MTEEEFEELWRRTKEHDEHVLSEFLNRWNRMSEIEKENYVITQEKEIASSRFWEDFTDDNDNVEYYPGQKEYLEEYENIRHKLKKENRI